VDREAVAAWVARTCADQGVPVSVSDPAVLATVVGVLGSPVGRARAHGASAPSTHPVAGGPHTRQVGTTREGSNPRRPGVAAGKIVA